MVDEVKPSSIIFVKTAPETEKNIHRMRGAAFNN